MPKVTDTIDYITLIVQEIAENRLVARDWVNWTPEERDAFRETLIAKEQAEIDRGRVLQSETDSED